MKCDFTKSVTTFTISDKSFTCPKEGGLLTNPEGFTGKFECPEFNLVCTSQNYCTDISDCIKKKEIAEDTTYIFGYTPSTKFKEDTTYNIQSEINDSKASFIIISKCSISFLFIAIIFIIYQSIKDDDLGLLTNKFNFTKILFIFDCQMII